MSAAEETIKVKEISRPKSGSVLERAVGFIGSVRFGVVQLVTLVVLSMIGMLIIQQNVQGFDAYFASLTPAEKMVYGSLGFFDIYHSWYYNFLLLLLSLNIILASIDHFPAAWSYISKPKLTATRDWLLSQPNKTVFEPVQKNGNELAEEIRKVFEQNGLKAQITESSSLSYPVDENGRKNFSEVVTTRNIFVFGESGKFNRIGAYIIHVFLLTLFLGHFVALTTGFDADVRMIPGDGTDKIQMIQYDLDRKEKFDVQLPFTMTCTDIQQKLIDPRGSIDVTNTLDWRTQMRVDDPEYGSQIADISMNKPFSYRGYRFFQAQTIPVGNARKIKLELTPDIGGEKLMLDIPRMGSATLADGTRVEYDEFLPDFAFNSDGKPDTRTGEYNNPVAVLNVIPPQGDRTRVFAFASKLADNIPVGAPKAGYKWRLAEFEKSPFAHVLSIKYDPYSGAFIAWYFGGFGLMGALGFVFFFSHKRVWALIEKRDDGTTEVVLGGNANRNPVGLEEKFGKIVGGLERSEPPA
ncbi:MAG: cytochrome c biogenesis protein ResB [Saprospiraceae bacterium]|nr:cytochrome c biogenesis protein ResB [Pyrinomonadaceae bacterium]